MVRHNHVAGLLLVGLGLLLALGEGCSTPEASSPKARAEGGAEVGVDFNGDLTLTVEQIKERAIAALKAKGFTPDASAGCAISVSLRSGEVGCVAMFVGDVGKPYGQVHFDQAGRVTTVVHGITKEGVPPRGAPLPIMVPREIRVRVLAPNPAEFMVTVPPKAATAVPVNGRITLVLGENTKMLFPDDQGKYEEDKIMVEIWRSGKLVQSLTGQALAALPVDDDGCRVIELR